MPDPSDRDIQRTSEEAQRLLAELETAGSARPGWPFSRSIALAVLGLAALAALQHLGENQGSPGRLAHRPSCGSPASGATRWWPVLGPDDPALLAEVRRSYCGDAYINANGYLQVASFDNEAEADSFRDRISAATGISFRVGDGTTIKLGRKQNRLMPVGGADEEG